MNADSDGRTPLIWAVDRGNLRAVEILVAKGAEIYAKVCFQTTQFFSLGKLSPNLKHVYVTLFAMY